MGQGRGVGVDPRAGEKVSESIHELGKSVCVDPRTGGGGDVCVEPRAREGV